MKPKFTLWQRALLLLALAGCSTLVQAQLKIGDNPTSIQKSSILELESTRQGLLLPRLSDTAAINLLSPPNGMIIYLNTDQSLRLRSNGSWVKIADLSTATSNWSLTGNTGTNPATNFIGTIDGQPLVIRTSNAERLRIDAAGNVGIGQANPTAKLNVDGTVKLENLPTSTTDLDVLVIAADGSVSKRTIASTTFENAIRAINGIQRQELSITAAPSLATDTVQIENRQADSTIALYLPVQNGSSGVTKPYGFLTFPDWQKIQSAIQTITIGAVATVPNVNGATLDSTGAGTRVLVLHPADATNPGIVTAGAQTFGGDKTFNNGVTVNGTTTLNNLTTNASSDTVLVSNNGVIQKRVVSASAFGNAIRSINGNRDSAQKIAFRDLGADLTVSTNGTDSVYLNVPSASASARGVLTTGTQTIAGTKTFQDTAKAATALIVGSSGNANSTTQLTGSLSLGIRTVNASGTLTGTDNTVLANTTTGAITLTLPAPTGLTGRVYTIKKVGSGGIDNALTITPTSATIDGGSNYVIYNDWTFVTLQTDGTNWFIIKK
ncbi:hypothetical protein [Pseudobacter ginsenosidimutans]|uniref:Uncharacterized protein n=1 Tax=Pseudobacter ginsenosidimutans TaxID=661488 RepID=A0A4Q7MSQ1_9BACT|nr:hypothetical protein [Pseudobacter ginsenosidimutans]QEC41370.1 hypothetical protein FSB84_06545 [Pseudobacter ginsenosidimutans]RZS71856.1 hypothetical protein EV199_3769 [Pseudobacter ginsenosidimutans]